MDYTLLNQAPLGQREEEIDPEALSFEEPPIGEMRP